MRTGILYAIPALQLVDITALKLPEEKLRDANKQVTNILENMRDSFASWDRDWRYSYVNAAAERELGYRREDLLGRDMRPLFHPDSGDPARVHYVRAMVEHIPISFERFYPPLSIWGEVRAYPSADGGLSVFFRNVTEQRRQQIPSARAKRA